MKATQTPGQHKPQYQPVKWYEGMLLSPQHFQQHDLYVEERMLHQLQRTSPYFDGILDLTLDLNGLSSNTVSVSYVHAVMPDGTVVEYGKHTQQDATVQANAPPPDKSKQSALSYTLDTLPEGITTIYLAVAKNAVGNDPSTQEKLKRYDSYGEAQVKNLFDSNNQVEVTRLRTKLQLLTDAEITENYSYLPILKLAVNKGQLEIVDYTPPRLSFAPLTSKTPEQTDLWHQVETRIATLRLRASVMLNHLEHQTADASALNFHQKMEIHNVTKRLPGLKVLLNSMCCHPFDIYVALVDLVSGMAIMQQKILPTNYKDYNHYQLKDVLQPLLDDMDDILTRLKLNYDVHTFTQRENGDWIFEFGKWPSKKQFDLAFKLAPGVSLKQLQSWIKTAFICSEDKAEGLIAERVKGALRQQVDQFVDADLKQVDDELLFSVTRDSEWFSANDASNPVLFIKNSNENLDKYAPAAINIYSTKRGGD